MPSVTRAGSGVMAALTIVGAVLSTPVDADTKAARSRFDDQSIDFSVAAEVSRLDR